MTETSSVTSVWMGLERQPSITPVPVKREGGRKKCTRLPLKDSHTIPCSAVLQYIWRWAGDETERSWQDLTSAQRGVSLRDLFLSWQQESLVVIGMNTSNGKGSQGPKPDPVIMLFSCICWFQTKPKPPPILGQKKAQEEDKMNLD